MKPEGNNHHLSEGNEGPFRALMEQSSVSIQIHTMDGKLFKSNEAFEKLYAFNKETLKGLYEKYNVRTDQQVVKLGIQPLIEKVFAGESFTFPEYKYDGIDTLKTINVDNPVSRTVWMQTKGFPIKDKNGKVLYAVFMSEDISEKKKIEEELKDSEERFRATFEQAAVGIAHVAPNGRFLRINRQFCEIVGSSMEEMQTLTFQNITHPEDLIGINYHF